MAAASPSPLTSSVEKTNGAKLSRLLIDGGTTVLRNVFDGYHSPANLAAGLNAHYSTLKNLYKKRVLHQSQWDKLFPPGGATPDSKTFDITLLFLLLTNICGLSPPPSGWHKPPPSSDASFEANLARVKLYRNELYGHVTSTGVITAVFNVKWQEISAVLVALGLNPSEVVGLKAAPCGEDYISAVITWVKTDGEIKAQLREVLETQQEARHMQEEDHRTLQDTHEEVKDVLRAQKEEHLKQHKARQIQEEDHRTLQDTHNAVEVVLRAQQEEHRKQQKAGQIQEEDHRTLHDTHKVVEGVMQIHQDTNQQVKTISKTQREVRHTQLEDHETIQINMSTLEDVRLTSTKTQEMLDKVHLTQMKTQETMEGVAKIQEERFKAFEADLHEIKQSVGSLKEQRKSESQGDEALCSLAKSEFKGDIEYHVGRFQEDTRETTPVEFFGVPVNDEVLLQAPADLVLSVGKRFVERQTYSDHHCRLSSGTSEERVLQSFFQALAAMKSELQEQCLEALVDVLGNNQGTVHVVDRLREGKNAVSRPALRSNQLLRNVSEKVGHWWKKLARELNLTEGKIEAIVDEEYDHQERCHKALQQWCQENGEQATIRKLMLALNKTGLAEVNEDVINCLVLPRP